MADDTTTPTGQSAPKESSVLTEDGQLLVTGFGSFLGLHSERLQPREGRGVRRDVSLLAPLPW